MARVFTGDASASDVALEAQALAARTGNFLAYVYATVWLNNGRDDGAPTWASMADELRRAREELTALGAPHTYVAWLCANEADILLQLGEWRGCADRLRVALGSTPGPIADAGARLTATRLAVWQGRLAEAQAHLARAEELFDETSGFLAFDFDAVRAEVAVAAGATDRAITAARAGLDGEGTTPVGVERLVPLAARAAADAVQVLRDRGDDPAAALARLDDLQHRYPTVVADPEPGGAVYRKQVTGNQAWYQAEVLRGRQDPAAATAWEQAAETFREIGLPRDEAYARWRLAEALLRNRSSRDAAVAALRRAYYLAVDLRAEPLQSDLEALARHSRTTLDAVADQPSPDSSPLPGLTPREQEILAHLVAGRTYSEIARELVVSEKTVSVHVSNMLRKTGTANRIELAQRARRRTAPTSDMP
jgi:DNA-binding CsgD family transcriptional regulator